ncbi:MAG: hypothetical protein NC110_04995 [Ruminococcus sp.]|nr:hypothetical protein [Ruminococcus sp.]
MNKSIIKSKSNQIAALYLLLTGFVFTIAFMLLRFPAQAGEGVKYGLNLCVSTVIPSLFPFMVLSSFFAESGICSKIGELFNRWTQLIFKQPGVSSSVILLSNIGGLPIGAKMVKQFYEKEQITREQGQRLLLFCINPGPAFVISSVGHYMLGSAKAGVILFFSQMLASLMIGFLTRFIADENSFVDIPCNKETNKPNFIQALVCSVSQSTSGMLAICSWVIIFSSLEKLIDVFELSKGMKLFLSCILEVTNGCNCASGKLPIPIIAGIIGWSGFCAHFQVMSSVIKLRMKLKYFLTGRIINGALSVIICQLLLCFFPVEENVFLSVTDNFTVSTSACFSVSLGMFLMCLLLLLGDNFKIKFRKDS